jgi:hypothetical protein
VSEKAAFSATYADWKLIKTRRCVQVVMEIPLERANEAYRVLGGMPSAGEETWFAIARLNLQQPQEEPDNNKSPTTEPEAPAPSGNAAPVRARNRLAQRAGMLCNDPLFVRYLWAEGRIDEQDKDLAAAYVREFCGVNSRADILPGTEAATRLDLLESAFVCERDHARYVEPAAEGADA